MAYDNLEAFKSKKFANTIMFMSMIMGFILLLCDIFAPMSSGVTFWVSLMSGVMILFPLFVEADVLNKNND